jgi:hypothetical protein
VMFLQSKVCGCETKCESNLEGFKRFHLAIEPFDCIRPEGIRPTQAGS